MADVPIITSGPQEQFEIVQDVNGPIKLRYTAVAMFGDNAAQFMRALIQEAANQVANRIVAELDARGLPRLDNTASDAKGKPGGKKS